MKKKTRNFALGALIVVLVVYFALSFSLGWVVKAAVNRIGPRITQTTVVLTGAHISPISGGGVLTGLTVGNPPGWSSGRALYLGRISVSLQPFSLFSDHIMIDEIDIDQPEFSYETKFFSSNISDLLTNIGESKSGSVATTGDAAARPIKFEVKHLRLTHGKVTLGVGTTELPLPLPTIELHDLGTNSGGFTSDQLALVIMKSVSSEIVSATTHAASKIGATAGATAAEGVKKTGESIKKLWNRGK